MSGRLSRWIFLVALPLLIALYASYPPAGVTVNKERLVKQRAQTAEEAEEHGVEPGDEYVVEAETLEKKWLPLALGNRDTETELIERREDGSYVVEQTTSVRGQIKLGLDLAGGTELLYEMKPQEGQRLEESTGQTIDILKQRIDPGNVKEYRIQPLENHRILLQVPRATTAEVEQLKSRLQRMGKLEFKLAVPRVTDQERFRKLYEQAEQGSVPEGYVRMHIEDDPEQPFYLVEKGEPEITGRYLASVQPSTDDTGRPAVGFRFDARGSRIFARVTENNVGRLLAITLDGVLKSAPRIRTRIAGAGVIEGDFTEQDVADMVNILRAGSLPMDIQLLQESTVGPELGRDSIRQGLRALAVAGLLVLVFIGIYYMACGLVADGALIMNLLLLIGALSLLGAALTLPGMAGILLTVGMAVDANVLIFERIREESASGKGLRAALRNGYDRAFTTIVDANITTLLTAVILYLVGTGPVRGFAITLSFGILLSMFTALVVTRLALETFIENDWMKQFKMMSAVGTPEIDFSRIRKPAYIVSTLVVVLGLAVFAARSGGLYDIDFTGGSLVRLSLAKPTSVSEMRSRLIEGGFPEAQVQAFRSGEVSGNRFTDFGVRLRGAGRSKLEETMVPTVRQKLTEAGLIAGEEKSVEVTPDGRALSVRLLEPKGETAVRQALAGEGGPYALEDVSTVVCSEEDALTNRVIIHFAEMPALVDRMELWARALGALDWAGLETRDYTVQKIEPLQEDSGLRFVLDQPIDAPALAAELRRRDFADIGVKAAYPEASAPSDFILTGEDERLQQLRNELPEGAELRAVPVAQIEQDTITADLTEGFSEGDIRLQFEKRDLPQVHIVPLDLQSTRWRLNLSDRPLRQRLQTIFAELAPRGGGVTFGEKTVTDDRVVIPMVLAEPMPFADVRHYIRASDLGTYTEGLIVNEERYSPETVVSEVKLQMPAGKADQIMGQIESSFGEARPIEQIVSIGAQVAEELQARAALAVLFASVIIVLYVAARFHAFRFGVAAVIALLHDVLITAGLIALADWAGVFGDVKINLAMLAAFLTILGYSLNDTIVVFDRIRENMGILGRKRVSADLINLSINQTLSRTVLTSLTTLMVVVVLYVLGGSVLRGLALTLIFGVVVGTYSSMFIASPVLLDWEQLGGGIRGFLRILFFPVRLPFKLVSAVRSGIS